MIVSPRRTRSKSKQPHICTDPDHQQPDDPVEVNAVVTRVVDSPNFDQPDRLPSLLTSHLTRLPKSDLRTLLKKQEWLRNYSPSFPEENNTFTLLKNTLSATLVFAQEEAGTAVCISSTGLILTCSHCVAENKDELRHRITSWLIFASGQVVKTKCIAWDQKRDLALCRIVASQEEPEGPSSKENLNKNMFPAISIAQAMPRKMTSLICIGHPGAEDLENVVPGVKTNYDTLYISQGKYRGYSQGQDIQDNENIGALKHDCWTYWGHSGAPLIDTKTGNMIGMHSSWDDTTGMRRGIGLEAIQSFLRETLTRSELEIPGIKMLRASLPDFQLSKSFGTHADLT